MVTAGSGNGRARRRTPLPITRPCATKSAVSCVNGCLTMSLGCGGRKGPRPCISHSDTAVTGFPLGEEGFSQPALRRRHDAGPTPTVIPCATLRFVRSRAARIRSALASVALADRARCRKSVAGRLMADILQIIRTSGRGTRAAERGGSRATCDSLAAESCPRSFRGCSELPQSA